MGDVRGLQPSISLLFRRFFVTGPARATVGTITAVATITAEAAAIALAAEATAAVITLAVAIGLAHHRRRAFLELLDADADIADHVFADPLLALDLGDRRRRRVDVEQDEVRLAVLVHAVGEGANPPILGLGDLTAETFDDTGHLGRQFFHLLGARVLTREKNMLIKRHGCPFQVGANPGVKPFEPSRKARAADAQEGGNAESRAEGPCHIKVAWKSWRL